jgi:hypothetical protein
MQTVPTGYVSVSVRGKKNMSLEGIVKSAVTGQTGRTNSLITRTPSGTFNDLSKALYGIMSR